MFGSTPAPWAYPTQRPPVLFPMGLPFSMLPIPNFNHDLKYFPYNPIQSSLSLNQRIPTCSPEPKKHLKFGMNAILGTTPADHVHSSEESYQPTHELQRHFQIQPIGSDIGIQGNSLSSSRNGAYHSDGYHRDLCNKASLMNKDHVPSVTQVVKPPLLQHQPYSPHMYSFLQCLRGRPRRSMLRRAVFSDAQRKGLEKMFKKRKYIGKPDRFHLAQKLGLKDCQVKIWFQNRRMKWRNTREREMMAAIKNNKLSPTQEDTRESIDDMDIRHVGRYGSNMDIREVHCGSDSDSIEVADNAEPHDTVGHTQDSDSDSCHGDVNDSDSCHGIINDSDGCHGVINDSDRCRVNSW